MARQPALQSLARAAHSGRSADHVRHASTRVICQITFLGDSDVRLPLFGKTKNRGILLTSLLLASLLLAACGETSPSIQNSHGPIAGTVQAAASTISEFPIPTAKAWPSNIAPGSDGNLWFTEYNGNKIGRITTSGAISEFPIPTVDTDPAGITTGPDKAMWFTEASGNKIGRITTSGTISE